ncbi:MAG TPA: hypothetical protein VK041_00055, partial [Opitutales bacterium]|nr:hypothetical protein [Opitutales bacterium]
VPNIAVVIGEGGSGGALGIGVANRVLILENAYYSVISPEGCAAILWKDRSHAPRAADALKLGAHDLKELGVVDDVLAEPHGGAHTDYDIMAKTLKDALSRHLAELDKLSPESLTEERYKKYRTMGVFEEKILENLEKSAEEPTASQEKPEKDEPEKAPQKE